MIDVKNKIVVSRKLAAELLDCSLRTIDYLTASKQLRARRIKGKVVFLVSELESKVKNDQLGSKEGQ
jgi:hypothetical protein